MPTSQQVAAVFPGQGSQRRGMGADFCEQFTEARLAFEEASDALALDVAALCFEDDPRLDLTEFAQPAIVTVEIAAYRALAQTLGLEATWFGGHSLGEYAALVAAGVLDLAAAVQLVRERGRYMQDAVPVGAGSMTAVISPGIAAAFPSGVLDGLQVDVANLNSPDQIVLSGSAPDVEAAVERARKVASLGKIRAIPLRVSAPFHCRLMEPARQRLEPLLLDAAPRLRASLADRVTSNASGTWHEPDATAVARALAEQVTAPVRWLDNMQALGERAARVIEIGPAKPLSAFFKATGRRIEAVTDV
ncbi:MAG: ACP S-malonyltransferase, partial [Deltaproteobacteria bacterium]